MASEFYQMNFTQEAAQCIRSSIKKSPDKYREALELALNATQLIQTLQRNGKPSMLGRAIGEFGRIFKTLHTLTYFDDERYQRRILYAVKPWGVP